MILYRTEHRHKLYLDSDVINSVKITICIGQKFVRTQIVVCGIIHVQLGCFNQYAYHSLIMHNIAFYINYGFFYFLNILKDFNILKYSVIRFFI